MLRDVLFPDTRLISKSQKLRERQQQLYGFTNALWVAVLLVVGAQLWLSQQRLAEDVLVAGVETTLTDAPDRLARELQREVPDAPIETLTASEAWVSHQEELKRHGSRLKMMQKRDFILSIVLSLLAVVLVIACTACLALSNRYRRRADEAAVDEAKSGSLPLQSSIFNQKS